MVDGVVDSVSVLVHIIAETKYVVLAERETFGLKLGVKNLFN